jgi:hypothetical protein
VPYVSKRGAYRGFREGRRHTQGLHFPTMRSLTAGRHFRWDVRQVNAASLDHQRLVPSPPAIGRHGLSEFVERGHATVLAEIRAKLCETARLRPAEVNWCRSLSLDIDPQKGADHLFWWKVGYVMPGPKRRSAPFPKDPPGTGLTGRADPQID